MNDTAHAAIRSRTVWLGLLIATVGYLQANVTLIEQVLRPFMRPETVPMVMGLVNMFLGLGVIIVRFYTDSALGQK